MHKNKSEANFDDMGLEELRAKQVDNTKIIKGQAALIRTLNTKIESQSQ